MKRRLSSPLVTISALMLVACASPTYTFDAADGSNSVVEYAQGVPVLYSQGTSSIVAVRPASRTIKGSEDLAFQVVVTNAGTQPIEVTAEDVSLYLTRNGKATSYSALSFDEYAELKGHDKNGAGMAVVGALAILSGGLSGYGSGIGSTSLMSSGNSGMSNYSTVMTSMSNSDKKIDDEVSASDGVYLHRTTVQPDQTQAGMVYFNTSELSKGDRFDIEVTLPVDTHRVSFVLAQGQ